jgi:hypothetical protein
MEENLLCPFHYFGITDLKADGKEVEEKTAVLEFICRKLAKGKRAVELKILKHLIEFHDRMKVYYIRINELTGMQISALEEASAVRVLTNGFGKEAEKEKYRNCVFIEKGENGGYRITEHFYCERYHDTALQLFQKYVYENRFISSSELIALSKHPRKTDSADANHIFKRMPEDKDNRIYLFIRKNKDDQEAKEFCFLGEMKAAGDPQPVQMEATHDDAFEIEYHMDVPVRDDIYAYLMGE